MKHLRSILIVLQVLLGHSSLAWTSDDSLASLEDANSLEEKDKSAKQVIQLTTRDISAPTFLYQGDEYHFIEPNCNVLVECDNNSNDLRKRWLELDLAEAEPGNALQHNRPIPLSKRAMPTLVTRIGLPAPSSMSQAANVDEDPTNWVAPLQGTKKELLQAHMRVLSGDGELPEERGSPETGYYRAIRGTDIAALRPVLVELTARNRLPMQVVQQYLIPNWIRVHYILSPAFIYRLLRDVNYLFYPRGWPVGSTNFGQGQWASLLRNAETIRNDLLNPEGFVNTFDGDTRIAELRESLILHWFMAHCRFYQQSGWVNYPEMLNTVNEVTENVLDTYFDWSHMTRDEAVAVRDLIDKLSDLHTGMANHFYDTMSEFSGYWRAEQIVIRYSCLGQDYAIAALDMALGSENTEWKQPSPNDYRLRGESTGIETEQSQTISLDQSGEGTSTDGQNQGDPADHESDHAQLSGDTSRAALRAPY
ncbi:MAG: hypothetical protein M1831_006073 [Alyxoria varia]|nr:MAG: hypothetical protein M1831_006073 [Alyxoria varia]